MKYMLLIYSNAKTWEHPIFAHAEGADQLPEAELDAMRRDFDALVTEIHESGEVVYSAPLADPSTSRTVRVRDGVTLATDGPYAEAKEQLAGFFILDCTPERAEEIAARWPDSRFCAVELRPVMRLGGQEM